MWRDIGVRDRSCCAGAGGDGDEDDVNDDDDDDEDDDDIVRSDERASAQVCTRAGSPSTLHTIRDTSRALLALAPTPAAPSTSTSTSPTLLPRATSTHASPVAAAALIAARHVVST